MRQFPEHYPEGCPPANAIATNGNVYRLTHNNPARESDFLTYVTTGQRTSGDRCLRCGLSVFETQRGAAELFRYMQRRHPNGTSLGRFIARLQITPEDGLISYTGRPPHLTWWWYDDVDPTATFREIVEEIQDALPN